MDHWVIVTEVSGLNPIHEQGLVTENSVPEDTLGVVLESRDNFISILI